KGARIDARYFPERIRENDRATKFVSHNDDSPRTVYRPIATAIIPPDDGSVCFQRKKQTGRGRTLPPRSGGLLYSRDEMLSSRPTMRIRDVRRAGFSLLELLVVIAILALL